ncbi:MAG: DoxX family protein [Ardenticatenaceae bacterium]
MNILLWVAQLFLAIAFLISGSMDVFRYEQAKEHMSWVRAVPKGLVTFIGTAEILGAIGLILPALTGILPALTSLAALGLALIMLLAAGFHARRREFQDLIMNVALLAPAVFVAYGRWRIVPL